MISDNILKFKVLEDIDARETNNNLVYVYFPFENSKSTFNRYRAQLFYAPSSAITSISLAIAKGSEYPDHNLPIGIYAYENNVNTNYGIDNPNNIVVSYQSNTILIANEAISEYEEDGTHLPFVTVDGLNIAVTEGSAYWLVFDCGKVYDPNIDGNRTHDFYFSVTSGGWTAIGTAAEDAIYGYVVTEAQNTGLTLINTGPLRSDIATWNFTDFPRDHIFMINGASPVDVAFSLEDLNMSQISAYSELYGTAEWQDYSYKQVNITDLDLGGNIAYGNKTLYTRFRRPAASSTYSYSYPIISTILYTPGRPIITEVILSYIGTV